MECHKDFEHSSIDHSIADVGIKVDAGFAMKSVLLGLVLYNDTCFPKVKKETT